MENFIVSARKYRPATFDTVVGQQSITTTLKNAIKTKQLAHAYLFCGPRGVGKTTCARIFAKTINCFNPTDDLEACNECESCKAFNGNRSYNVHELDAASNNSVEDIRSLIDQVRIPPQIGKYSVYIVDEVHMLSTQAFNAFLKTLEEPPAHAKFILATTEKHKIIPTILSRCQIFDFNRIKVEDIVEHLAKIAKREDIDFDLDGLNVIAQKADGGLRDALSFFDQIVSFSGKQISYQHVIQNLNVLDYDYYFKLTYAFIENNITSTFLIFNEILENGFDAHHFITGLSEHFRNVLVCKDKETLQLLEVGANIRDNYIKQAQESTVDFLFKALNINNQCDLNYRDARNKRLLVELALLQLCNITNQYKEQVVVKTVAEPIKNTGETITKNEVQKENKPLTISIKDALAGNISKTQEKDSNKLTEVNKVEENVQEYLPVKQEDIHIKWLEFAQSVKLLKPRFFAILTSNTPILKNDFIIELLVATDLQKEEVDVNKTAILQFLRKELRNQKIDLNVIISDEKPKTRLYTDAEKFKYLSDKNSKLNKLRQQLNLDF